MRRTKTVVIASDGRDKGKRYLVTEMSAAAGEEWAIRVLLALARSGVEMPDDFQSLGMAGVAAFAMQALSGLRFEDAKPLLDEMMACVQFLPDPRHPDLSRPLIEDDTEEVRTRIELRREVFELHTGFFMSAGASTSTPASQATAA